MNSRVIPLTVKYFKVSPMQFEKILKNHFRFYNIVKLIRKHLSSLKKNDDDVALLNTTHRNGVGLTQPNPH